MSRGGRRSCQTAGALRPGILVVLAGCAVPAAPAPTAASQARTSDSADTGESPVSAPGFAGCTLDAITPVISAGGPSIPRDQIAWGSWVGEETDSFFGHDVTVGPDGAVYVQAPGKTEAGVVIARASLYAFDGPPVGVSSAAAAPTRLIWIDPNIDGGTRPFPGMNVANWGPAGASLLAVPSYRPLYGHLDIYSGPLLPGVVPSEDPVFHRMTADGIPSSAAYSVTAGDLDGDGFVDLVVGVETLVQSGGSVVVAHRGPILAGVSAMRGDADWTFDMNGWEPIPGGSSIYLSRAAIHDVDGDGANDVLVGSVACFPDGVEIPLPVDCKPGGLVLWTGATTPGSYGRGTETAVIEGTCMSCLVGYLGPVGRVGPDPERVLVAAVGRRCRPTGWMSAGRCS